MEAMKFSLLGKVSIPALTTPLTIVVWKGAKAASYAVLAASRSVTSVATGSAASEEISLAVAVPRRFSKSSFTNRMAAVRR